MADDIATTALTVRTTDGLTLAGDTALPAHPVAAAALAHPHPQMGGDRHNTVVEALFRALPRAGVATARVDFRGVGRSEGAYGEGVGERLDIEAALLAAADLAPNTPLWVVGYSFGGDVALSVDLADLAGWIAVAPPLRVLAEPPSAATPGRPTTLVVPAHDQFCPPNRARSETAAWADTEVVEVPMGDHFLAGRLDTVAEMVIAAIRPA